MARSQNHFGELDLDAIGLDEQSQARADVPEHTRIAVATDDVTGNTGPSSQRTAPSTSGVAARSRSYQEYDDPVGAIRELYAQGRADLALELASEIVSALESDESESDSSAEDDGFGGLIPIDDDESEADDADHTMMLSDAAGSTHLAAMTSSSRIPRLLLGPQEISALPMDARMGFLLGHIDGVQTMEEILDVCAMPESDALELLERLRAMGVISVE